MHLSIKSVMVTEILERVTKEKGNPETKRIYIGPEIIADI